MNRCAGKTSLRIAVSCLLSCLVTIAVAASLLVAQADSQSTSSSPSATPAPSASSSTVPASKASTTSPGAPTAQDIAAAKASGKVWVNTETGVYHKGGRWYGKTKAGKFMTESDAKAAGYKIAKRD
ncbi:MAG TPA: hypothetical protein VK828_11615 [Terriglobales bacterium]|jgi:hypothetical protein|nr:hypothetical protein [Terriglobales bacterium]